MGNKRKFEHLEKNTRKEIIADFGDNVASKELVQLAATNAETIVEWYNTIDDLQSKVKSKNEVQRLKGDRVNPNPNLTPDTSKN